MKRPNSTTLRRHAGFMKAGNIEKELKKIRKEFAWMRTEEKEVERWIDVALRDLRSSRLPEQSGHPCREKKTGRNSHRRRARGVPIDEMRPKAKPSSTQGLPPFLAYMPIKLASAIM
jgi:hypothetical protein